MTHRREQSCPRRFSCARAAFQVDGEGPDAVLCGIRASFDDALWFAAHAFMMSICRRFSMLAKLTSGS